MASSASRDLARATRRIDALAAERLPTQRLVESVAEELRAAMPVDALFMAATDPDTLVRADASSAQTIAQMTVAPAGASERSQASGALAQERYNGFYGDGIVNALSAVGG